MRGRRDLRRGGNGKHRRGAARSRMLEPLEARCLLAGDLVSQWLADDLNTTVGDGSAIVHWYDSVANIDAQAVGSPTLVTDAVSGRSTVRFDPVDGTDGFRIRSTVNPVVGATDFSVVVAFQTDSQSLQGGQGRWFDNTGLVDSTDPAIRN